MKKLKRNQKCPKCGERSFAMKYLPIVDSVELTCYNCKYIWDVLPLDCKKERK